MAAQIITIAIEKGGAGKTVTASNLAYLMGDEGKKVLCIDTDPQGNLTSALSGGNGITSGVYNGRALFDMFDGFRYTKTKDYITETEYENVDMIPCSAQTPRINQRIPGCTNLLQAGRPEVPDEYGRIPLLLFKSGPGGL